MEYAKAGEATLQNFVGGLLLGGNPPKFFIFDEITARWPGKKVEKNIVAELHVNNVTTTRSVLDVEKNYCGFKISGQRITV